MMRSTFLRPAVLLPLLLGAFACARPGGSEGETPQQTRAGVASVSDVPFDLQAVMDRVHYSFRQDGESFAAGHSTHAIEVGAEGFVFTPRAFVEERKFTDDARRRELPQLELPIREGEAVSFASSRIVRGGEVLGKATSSMQVEERDGSLTLSRGEVREHFRNTEAGVEQSWTFAARPDGAGELVVSVPLQVGAFVSADADGLHFSSGEGPGVRYGHGTWIDAEGKKSAVPATFADGSIVLRVPAALVDGSSYPAVLDPVISSEIEINGTLQVVRSMGSHRSPRVATDGTQYLVVWEDTRGGSWDIYAARVTSAGSLMDLGGIAVTTASSINERSPDVVWNGSQFVVSWIDGRNGVDWDIAGARISAAGVVQDPGGLLLIGGAASQWFHRMARVGSNVIFVWQEEGAGDPDIYGVRLDGAFAVVGGGGFAIANSGAQEETPRIAVAGSTALVVWEDARSGTTFDIYGARVDASNTVLDPLGIEISASAVGHEWAAAVASDGANFLVGWQDSRNDPSMTDVFVARVGASGMVSDTTPIQAPASALAQGTPSIGWTGSNYLVTWTDSDNVSTASVRFARLSTAGNWLDVTAQMLSAPTEAIAQLPAVVGSGSSAFVVWESSDGSAVDIRGARVTSAGVVQDDPRMLITKETNPQTSVRVATDNSNYFVIWNDYRGLNWEIWGTRVTPAGAVLDPAGILIEPGPSFGGHLAVGYGGGNYLVAWAAAVPVVDGEEGDIYGRLYSAAGVAQGNAFPISTALANQLTPAIGWNGSTFLVAWSDSRSGTSWDVYGARVSPSGMVQDPSGIAISAVAGTQQRPAVGAVGTEFFLVWEDTRGAVDFDIYGARVLGNGVAQANVAISTAPGDQAAPNLSCAASGCFAAWEDSRSGTMWEVFGAKLSAAMVAAPVNGALVSTNSRAPAAAFDGVNHLVVWQDARSNTDWDLYGSRFDSTGLNLDPGGFVIANTAQSEYGAAVASEGSEKVLVAYSFFDESPNVLNSRVRARTVGPSAPSAPVANDASKTTPEDTPVAITLTGTGSGTLSYAVVTQPANGTLSGSAPNLTYTPNADYFGADSFTFTVSNGTQTSSPATVSLTVTPVNDAPVALDTDFQTPRNTPVQITLSATDVDGDALTYTIVSNPANGTLSGSGATRTFTPNANFTGTTSLTFRASDGLVNSNLATVTITVVPGVNSTPVANSQNVVLDEDTPKAVTLTGSDADGDTLTYTVLDLPARGMLSGTPPNLTYTPNADYFGADSFTFVVDDGVEESAPAIVSLQINPVNDAPVAHDAAVNTAKNTPVNITLQANDVEGDPLTFTVTQPANGTLTGSGATLTFTPTAGFFGTTSFNFTASDGLLTSNTATVTITVANSNGAPVANADSLALDEDTSLAFTLSGTDPDGDSLTYSLVSLPAHGALTGMPPNLTYTPAANYHGPDSMSFTVSDGTLTSAAATVSFTVRPVNDTPVATSKTVATGRDTPVAITLQATDVDGDTLSFTVTQSVQHGTLTGTAPNLTYTPDSGYLGADELHFEVTDGVATDSGVITINVTGSNQPPVAESVEFTVLEDEEVEIVLSGTDPEGATLTYRILTQPTNGTLQGTPPTLVYMPDADFSGTDSFTYDVNDGTHDSDVATVTIVVRPVNDAPVAEDRSYSGKVGQAIDFTLGGSDVESDDLTFAVVEAPASGELTGTAPDLTYTAAEEGTFTLTFTVSDGEATSEPGTITFNISAEGTNQPPTVAISASTLKPQIDETVLFTTTASDPEDDALTFRWEFGDGETSSEQSPSHAYASAGTFVATLVVSDGTNDVEKSLSLQVLGDGPVIVDFDVPATGEEAKPILFKATAEGDGLGYAWDFGDGNTGNGPSVEHAYADDGRYTVRLRVTDAGGNEVERSREVIVSNLPPQIDPVEDQTVVAGTKLSVPLNGTDVAGDADPLTWRIAEGPGDVSASGTYSWTPDRTSVGSHVVRVELSDDDGGKTSTVFKITVTAGSDGGGGGGKKKSGGGGGCAAGAGDASLLALLGVAAFGLVRRKRG